MHSTSDWNKLSTKEQERLLTKNGFSAMHKPKGFEIDSMLRSYTPSPKQHETQSSYDPQPSQNHEAYDPYSNNTSSGPGWGAIPD